MCYNVAIMKKLRILSLLALTPLALLASCSTASPVGFSANWFRNVSTTIIPAGFEETLEYAVSFERSSTSLNGQFVMEYPEGGTYSVYFHDGSVTDDEGNEQKTYVYETTLTTTVKYTLGTESITLPEVVTTRVEFLDTAHELKPLSSHREVHASAPFTTPTAPGAKLDACYVKLDYVMDISYNHEKEKAIYNLTYLTKDNEKDTTKNNIENREIKIKCKGTFFDNEMMIPVLRAAELSSSMSLFTIDTTTQSLDSLTVKEGPTAVTLTQRVKYSTDTTPEEEEKTFNANEISIAYKKQNSGGTHKFTIAQRSTSSDSNKNRNVCLKYEYPVINSHGTMTYTLTQANFYYVS